MASEELRAVFTAVESISETLDGIGSSIDKLSQDFTQLDSAMSGNTAVSQAHESQLQGLKEEMDDLEDEIAGANRELQELTGMQAVNTATAATQAGAMELAGEAIEDAGNEAMTAAAQMGVLDTVMKELSLSGSALSVNIGAFNVSLRNLAPLIPIAASMGTLVSVFGAFAAAVTEATVALGAFTGAGAIAFAEQMQAEMEGLTDSAETFEAIMGGIRDLFVDAFDPLINAENAQFFVNLVEGLADLANRFAQAVNQMREPFMEFFGQIAAITNREFDAIATAIQDTFIQMSPILIDFFDWFMRRLPDALRFMADVTRSVAGPLSQLGNSIIDILTSIIEMAVHIFQGLAPALTMAANLANSLISVLESLSNGFIQAAVFVGVLTVAVTKFVGIANAVANIGMTMAQQMVNFASAARNAGGVLTLLGNKVQSTFVHLSNLGKVLTGQMALADATGKTQADLAEKYQEAAQEVEDLTNEHEALERQYLELMATVEGADVGEEIADQMDHAANAVDDVGDDMADASDDVARSMDDVTESFDVDSREMDIFEGRSVKEAVFGGGAAGITTGSLFDKSDDVMDDVLPEKIGKSGLPVPVKPQTQALDTIDSSPAPLPVVYEPGESGLEVFEESTDTISSKLKSVKNRAQDFGRATNRAVASVADDVRAAAMTGFTFFAGVADDSLQLVRNSFIEAGGASGLFESAVTNARLGVSRFRRAVVNAYSSLKTFIAGVWQSITALAAQASQSAKNTFNNIALAVSNRGVAAGFKVMISSAWGAVTALAASTKGAIITAGTFVSTLIPSILSTGAALNVAFAGIPLIIGAIVTASAALVGILGNLDNIASGAKSTFQGFKDAIFTIGNSLLNVGVPAWNAFLDIIEIAIAPFMALWDGLMAVGRALGLVSEDGASAGGIIKTIIGLFTGLMDTIGAAIEFIRPALSTVADVLYSAIITPFNIIAGIIHFVTSAFQTLIGFLMDKLPFVEEIASKITGAFDALIDTIASIPSFFQTAFQMAAEAIDPVLSAINGALETFIGGVNAALRTSNEVAGTDFDTIDLGEAPNISEALSGGQTTAQEVKENIASAAEEPDDEDVSTEPNVNLNLEDSIEQNVEVEADPEDKAGLKRIVKDAMNEANSIARRQEGMGR
jgi:phage-related protein